MTHKTKVSFVFIILLILLIVITVTMSSGCASTKFKETAISDSTQVKKENVGSVSRNESESESELDYYRKTWLFNQPQPAAAGKDSVFMKPEIKNYHYTQPIAYIEERGNLKEKERHFNYDSAWKALQDSTAARSMRESKTKETEVLGWKHIIAGCVGTALLIFLLQYFSKFKISKR